MQVGRLFTRRRLKWAAVAATLAAVVLFVVSAWGYVGYAWYDQNSRMDRRLVLANGGVYARHAPVSPDDPPVVAGGEGGGGASGWVARVDAGSRVRFVPSVTYSGGQYWVFMPWWPVVLALALTTVWLWRLDRMSPDRCPHCRCDLGGLESAFCPKCGKPTGREV